LEFCYEAAEVDLTGEHLGQGKDQQPFLWHARDPSGKLVSYRWMYLKAGSFDVHVTVNEAPDHQWWVNVRFNPARLWDPDGWSTCTASEAVAAADALVVWLARHRLVVPRCPHTERAYSLPHCPDVVGCQLADVRLTRVDTAIDFSDVQHPTDWVRLLMLRRQPRLRTKSPFRERSAWADSGRNGWRVRTYVKSQRHSRAPADVLRVEVQARTHKLRKSDLHLHVDLLDERRLHATFRAGFEWGLGEAFLAADTSLPEILDIEAAESGPTLARNFGKFMEAGRQPPPLSRPTLRKYTRIAQEYGLVPGLSIVDGTGSRPARWLSPVQGVERRIGSGRGRHQLP
jgi:hypothetical protein